jgi:alkylated DNA repair protein alkB family protein 8
VACTTEEAGIPGLYIIPDFVSKYEEQQLLLHIDQQPWQQLSKRRVQHYGYKFEYTQRGVDLNQQVEAMPDWTHTVVQRVQVR